MPTKITSPADLPGHVTQPVDLSLGNYEFMDRDTRLIYEQLFGERHVFEAKGRGIYFLRSYTNPESRRPFMVESGFIYVAMTFDDYIVTSRDELALMGVGAEDTLAYRDGDCLMFPNGYIDLNEREYLKERVYWRRHWLCVIGDAISFNRQAEYHATQRHHVDTERWISAANYVLNRTLRESPAAWVYEFKDTPYSWQKESLRKCLEAQCDEGWENAPLLLETLSHQGLKDSFSQPKDNQSNRNAADPPV